MAQHRRKFSPQFKAETAGFVIGTGRPIAEIVRELESGGGTLGNWVNERSPGLGMRTATVGATCRLPDTRNHTTLRGRSLTAAIATSMRS